MIKLKERQYFWTQAVWVRGRLGAKSFGREKELERKDVSMPARLDKKKTTLYNFVS